jgi:hypothetical protein
MISDWSVPLAALFDFVVALPLLVGVWAVNWLRRL